MSTTALDKPAARNLQLVSTTPKTISTKKLLANIGEAERQISLAAARIFFSYHKEVDQAEPGFIAERLQAMFGADMAVLQTNLNILISYLQTVYPEAANTTTTATTTAKVAAQ